MGVNNRVSFLRVYWAPINTVSVNALMFFSKFGMFLPNICRFELAGSLKTLIKALLIVKIAIRAGQFIAELANVLNFNGLEFILCLVIFSS